MTTIYLIVGDEWETCCGGQVPIAAHSTKEAADIDCAQLTAYLLIEAATYAPIEKAWWDKNRIEPYPIGTSPPKPPYYSGYSVTEIELNRRY